MTGRWRRWLAGGAALAGALAPLVGSPYHRASAPAVPDPAPPQVSRPAIAPIDAGAAPMVTWRGC